VIPLTVPKLSMSGEPVRVAAWLVEDGTSVVHGDPVAELETEKSTVELEAPASGILRIVVVAGVDAEVDAVIGHIDDGSPVVEQSAAPAAAATNPQESVQSRPTAPAPSGTATRTLVASPAARRLATERGIRLDTIVGSGPGGRIVASDVVDLDAAAGDRAPARELRDAVVAGVIASWRDIPHIHISGRLDGEGIAAARGALDRRITITDLLAFSLARALLEVPTLNGSYGDGILLSAPVHLSLAVATGHGVAAPTIRNAHELSVEEIAAERRRLVDAARNGQLEKRELGGGTATLSNLGAYPVDFFAPVITGPQICLVATGRLGQEPVAVDGAIAIRQRIWVNVTIDHRAADGEAGGRLLASLQQQLSSLPAQTAPQEER
jgi:pyruvate dehydrogenase E2 component (dihydrolipoamide acetyltransferase)